MKKLLPLACSSILLLALSACQSLPVKERLIVQDQLQVPPLDQRIREPALSKISPQQLQQVLNGFDPNTTKP